MCHDIFEVRCDCGWRGSSNELKVEYEICCPTVLLSIKCPSSACGHEFIQINECSGRVYIELEQGAFLSVPVSGNEDECRAIPRLSEKEKAKLKILRYFTMKENVK
ncbi:MAG: hypothetical protein NUV64_02560 [Parcubacteria group bacterium]|nr:hypothetical protein [Parcubacteria group bacterium]MCR4343056.1 hypothetical protein [Patescibacteria group bacterium]